MPFILLLAGCSGDSFELAEGGIGGTGMTSFGEITGFGSIYVNGVHYNTDSAQVQMNAIPTDINQLGLGMVVKVEGTVDGEQGIAHSIIFADNIQGNISTIDINTGRLQVLNHTIQCNDLTVFQGFNDLSDLHLDDSVAISGLNTGKGLIQAKRISLIDNLNGQVLLRGILSDYNPNDYTAKINRQKLDFSHTGLIATSLENGAMVVVNGKLEQQILQVTQVNVDMLQPQVNTGQRLHLMGIVASVEATGFHLNGLAIQTTPQTQYQFGQAQDLQTGVMLNVQTTAQNDTLIAQKIIFHSNSSLRGASNQIQIQAQVLGLPDNQTLSLLGQNLHIDLNTLFIDPQQRYFDVKKINIGDWVMIQGALDIDKQQIIIEKLRRKPYENGAIHLRAPLSEINPQQQTLHLAGIAVYTDNNTQYHVIDDRPQHFNSWLKNTKLPVDDAQRFFQQSQINAQVWLINKQSYQNDTPILAEQLILFTLRN